MDTGDGVEGLEKANKRLLKRGMKYDGIKGYTLDIDATRILVGRKSAKMTYKGLKGYMPVVVHISENGLESGDELREVNDPPASRNPEFLKYCERQMPKDKRIKVLRSDSAFFYTPLRYG